MPSRSLYKKRKAQGYCPLCGRKKTGGPLCKGCKRQANAEHREQYRARKEAGLCPMCKQVETGGSLCEPCREHNRLRLNRGILRCSRCRTPGHTAPQCTVDLVEAVRQAAGRLSAAGRSLVTVTAFVYEMMLSRAKAIEAVDAARAAGLLEVARIQPLKRRGRHTEAVWYRVVPRSSTR
jgi:hypothetical protein